MQSFNPATRSSFQKVIAWNLITLIKTLLILLGFEIPESNKEIHTSYTTYLYKATLLQSTMYESMLANFLT